MGPDFKTNNITTEIWMGTFHMPQFTSYAKPTLDDTVALKYVTGVGFQREGATGVDSAMSYKPQLHWHSMETETMCWSGSNSWSDAMSTFQYINGFLIHKTNTYNMWNMILDSNYNYVSWMTRAQNAMVMINPRAKPLPTVKYTGEFYIMKHFSYYISPGAVRVKSANTASNLIVSAFKNPDGSIIVEVSNSGTSNISPVIQVDTLAFTPTLAASSANTFILGGNPDTRDWLPATTPSSVQYTPVKKTISAATSGTLGVYDVRGRLVKLLSRNATGMFWDRTDASGKKATPGLYIIANKTGNNSSVIQKVICK
jgi:glucosylceramidase